MLCISVAFALSLLPPSQFCPKKSSRSRPSYPNPTPQQRCSLPCGSQRPRSRQAIRLSGWRFDEAWALDEVIEVLLQMLTATPGRFCCKSTSWTTDDTDAQQTI